MALAPGVRLGVYEVRSLIGRRRKESCIGISSPPIKIRPDGTLKVLDFGLAKALAGDVTSQVATQLPTTTQARLKN